MGDSFGDTFASENGILRAWWHDKYPEFGTRFGHLCWKEKLSHFRVRIEYRFVGEQVKERSKNPAACASGICGIMFPDLLGRRRAILKALGWPISGRRPTIIGDPRDRDRGTRSRLSAASTGSHMKRRDAREAHCADSTSEASATTRWSLDRGSRCWAPAK